MLDEPERNPIAAIEKDRELREIKALEDGDKYELDNEYKPWDVLYSTSGTTR